MKDSTKGLLIGAGVAATLVIVLIAILRKKKNKDETSIREDLTVEYQRVEQPVEPDNSTKITHNGEVYQMTKGTGKYVKNWYWKEKNGDTYVKVGNHGTHMTGKIVKTTNDISAYTG
jgi:hypothetical protein